MELSELYSSRESSALSAFKEPKTVNFEELPPWEFRRTVENGGIRRCHNLCILLWFLNGDVELTYDFGPCGRPLQLFKDVLRRGVFARYENLFDISPEGLDGGLGDTTLVPGARAYKVSVFPQILQFAQMSGTSKIAKSERQDMKTLILDYILRFEDSFRAYLGTTSKKRRLDAVNTLIEIVEAYVNDMVLEILSRWHDWHMTVGTSEPPLALSKKVLQRLWDCFLCFDAGNSLSEFVSRLKKRCQKTTRRQRTFCGPKIGYGMWIDGASGILLFCNSISSNSEVMPSAGFAIKQESVEESVKKMLLFINLSVLECFSWEMARG
ncbi:LAMI_0B06326g1_1 [Lachancea mirantina]|uniref:LAMI_0B06326g1_1 n=1 Tax=Lachancea mirantina TaxID=1230905 RepID=A0A1G4IWF9_9SACH|nr:LAMI_0B06326g1_1 [Lachancea mirantina]